jgi:hypothetical protein
MDHRNFETYTLEELYDALDSVDDVAYPGQKDAIENRIEELEVPSNGEAIGGWLILIALGIVITPFRLLIFMVPTYSEIFSTGIWQALTTQGSEAYNPLWAPIIILEIIINSGMLLVWFYLAYLFFTKKSLFPKVYIGLAIFSLAFILADAFAITLVLPNEPIFGPDTIQEVLRALVMVVIWVPYMLLSKRVKATFVNI